MDYEKLNGNTFIRLVMEKFKFVDIGDSISDINKVFDILIPSIYVMFVNNSNRPDPRYFDKSSLKEGTIGRVIEVYMAERLLSIEYYPEFANDIVELEKFLKNPDDYNGEKKLYEFSYGDKIDPPFIILGHYDQVWRDIGVKDDPYLR